MSMSSSAQHSAEITAARDHLALALDLDDQRRALELARQVAPYFAVAKVGLELFSVAGPTVVGELLELGFSVFVDLKLHDIPTTVAHAARVLGRLGASFTTVHAAGGRAMIAAAVDGFSLGASESGRAAPRLLAVSVLTSEAEIAPGLLESRIEVLAQAGAAGLICAAPDLAVVDRLAPQLYRVVPGIRPAGGALDDQARVATPATALRLGADLLVIGRPVSLAADPAAAAAAIAESLSLPS